MSDERPDWIDDVMRGAAPWEPPPSFGGRVVRAAIVAGAVVPERAFPLPSVSFVSRLRASAGGTAESLIVRLQGTIWIVRQYRELIWG